MKKIFTPLLFIFCCSALAQNVGIGTSTPSELLDVNGNINVSGSIKVNAVDGHAHQVLGKNGAGTLAWIDMSEFKNFKVFYTTSTTVWTVPTGVTKLVIEAWGAGGGGSKAGGGASGNYFMAKPDVVAGNTLSITCGFAGERGESLNNGVAGNGGSTQVVVNAASPGNLIARGGGGASTFSAGVPAYPWPQVQTHSIPIVHYSGECGTTTTETYSQYQAGVFVTSVFCGNGGNTPLLPNTGRKGGFVSFNTASPASRIRYYPALDAATFPGGGGGGTPDVDNIFGTYGGSGMVIVRW